VPGEPFSPETTLVAILGASEYPRSPNLSSQAFLVSAEELAKYFTTHPFNLPLRNLCNLFDHPGSPLEVTQRLSTFLTDAQALATKSNRPIRDLIFCYVGHGGFTKGGEQAYFLALRSTETDQEGVSSLRMADLARTLKTHGKGVRRYLILDCCFAEQAYALLQSSDLANAAHTKSLLEFPGTGTAMLCSSSARDVSKVPRGESYTMFSGALLDVLRTGDGRLQGPLSLEQVGNRVTSLISTKFPDQEVRPKVSSPDEKEGDVADIPLFPNAAHIPRSAEERVLNLEQKIEFILEKLKVLDDVSTRISTLATTEMPLEQVRGKTATSASNSGEIISLTNVSQVIPAPAPVRVEPSSFWSSRKEEARTLSKAPPYLQVEVRHYRRSRLYGIIWVLMSLLLSLLGVGSTVNVDVGASWLEPLRSPFTWLVVVFAGLSAQVLAKSRQTEESRRLDKYPGKWDALPVVTSMRSTKSIRILGDLSVRTPWFELGAAAYFLATAIISVICVTLALRAVRI
jgi:Caspase domain